VTGNDQKIENDLEDLVARVKKEQEEFSALREQISPKSSPKEAKPGMPLPDSNDESLPQKKNPGEMIVDSIFGEKITDKIRVAIAFGMGVGSYYLVSVFMPIIAISVAGYSAYRFFSWKRQQDMLKMSEEEIIDVDVSAS
jgi:hypothetical protein